MTFRDRPYPAFFSLAILLFLAATAGSDVVARINVSGEGVGKAVTEHFYYAFVQPVGTVMLLAPFALLGWMSASLAKRQGFERGLVLFSHRRLVARHNVFFCVSGFAEIHEPKDVDRLNTFYRVASLQERPTVIGLSCRSVVLGPQFK